MSHSKTTERLMELNIQTLPPLLIEQYKVSDSWLRIIRVSQKEEVICLPRRTIPARYLQPEIQHSHQLLYQMRAIQLRKVSMEEASIIRGRGLAIKFRPA